ncbi:MAG TPA: type II toxin-antitoxin system HicA family toxin [Allosphingosinicella sp.]|jgi:predicted RNA binding protein YcfA (HicA-like mRNA interferase family)|nr:type II toxin-antitoxin system HicA family toxin [Allosphingosinicella sp.]
MVKPNKLYELLRESPARVISFREFEQLLLAFGFSARRSRGSHRAYKHPDVPELLTIQPRGKDAQPYQVRRFLSMVDEFGLEMDD